MHVAHILAARTAAKCSSTTPNVSVSFEDFNMAEVVVIHLATAMNVRTNLFKSSWDISVQIKASLQAKER